MWSYSSEVSCLRVLLHLWFERFLQFWLTGVKSGNLNTGRLVDLWESSASYVDHYTTRSSCELFRSHQWRCEQVFICVVCYLLHVVTVVTVWHRWLLSLFFKPSSPAKCTLLSSEECPLSFKCRQTAESWLELLALLRWPYACGEVILVLHNCEHSSPDWTVHTTWLCLCLGVLSFVPTKFFWYAIYEGDDNALTVYFYPVCFVHLGLYFLQKPHLNSHML